MIIRGLGHLPDTDADVAEDLEKRHVAGLLVGGPTAAMASLDRRSLFSPKDQGGSSACVGCAKSRAIWGLLRGRGLDVPMVSDKGIYDVARLFDRPRQELFDLGCRPRAAMDGISEYGICAESRWPLEPSATDLLELPPNTAWINYAPPQDVFRAAAGALVTGHYRVDSGDIVRLLKDALAQGFFPVFGMHVDDGYFAYDGNGIYRGLVGPSHGGHMQMLCGFDDEAFWVLNSWGTGWGLGGFARLSLDFLASAACFDRIVVTAVPTTIS